MSDAAKQQLELIGRQGVICSPCCGCQYHLNRCRDYFQKYLKFGVCGGCAELLIFEKDAFRIPTSAERAKIKNHPAWPELKAIHDKYVAKMIG
jgi:hypothetical protein